MKLNHNRNRINTTVGDLIAAITDAALEYTDNTKDAYRLASVVLVEILKNAPLSADIVDPPFYWH